MPGLRRAQIAVLASILALVAAGAACTGWLSYYGDDVVWLGGGPARWIVAPTPPQLHLRAPADLETVFERTFDPEPDVATLALRALGRATVELNGRVVASPADFPASWKQTHSVGVASALRPGPNTIQVSVVHANGPAALNLAFGSLRTDTTWLVSIAGSNPRPARLASDSPELDPGLPSTGPTRPVRAFAASLRELAVFVVVSGLLLFGAGRVPARWQPGLPALATAVAVLAWVVLYVHNAGRLPETTGFDAHNHLDYIRYLLVERAIPLAHQGWQMYQPPLFYVLCAGVVALFGDGSLDAALLRTVTFAAGIAQILLLGAVARLLWPGRLAPLVLALGFGACLPMHLYLFHFVSNETLATALSTAVSYLVLRLLVRADAPSLAACIGLGACLGLAMLAKFSAALLAPPVAIAVAFAFWRAGTPPATAAIRCGAMLAAVAITCGWHFVRVWTLLGNPFLGNWDASLGFTWWQAPGYRTLADFLTFGRSLSAPWFAGTGGVPDGVYSTLWGDALASGTSEVQYGAPWNHRLVAAGYVLSLLPMVLVLSGGAIGLGRVLGRCLDPSRRAAALYLIALFAVALAALGYMTLRVPSYGQAKAFYVQPAMVALCVAFVFGALRMLDLSGRFRPVLWVALATCGMTFYASVWVDAGDASVQRGWLALATRDPTAAQTHFREALGDDPEHAGALAGLALTHAERERWSDAAETASRALERISPEHHPKLASRALSAAALADLRLGRPALAERSLRRAIELAPGEGRNYLPLVELLREQGRDDEAADVLRDALWVAPHDAGIYRLLGDLAPRRR